MTCRHVHDRRPVQRLTSAAAKIRRSLAFMEVCGTHTVSAFRCGLHSLLPPNVRLLSGPGCPVCVTSQGDVDQMIELARDPRITLCTYGDMLRVTGSRGSLERVRGEGADVRIVYSALDTVRIAQQEPAREVVFSAVGFETTAPATAAAVTCAVQLRLSNFSVLTSHKRILPAMHALLSSGKVQIDGFLCPGHVAVIIGVMPFHAIARLYARPCVVVGFEDYQIVEGLASLTEMALERHAGVENLYPQVVMPWGNRHAMNLLRRVMEPAEARWRGLGLLPHSGLVLRRTFREFDARRRFALAEVDVPEPAGCRCGDVITARCTPEECRLFATVCTPVRPIGPCMVSGEGTCQAWFRYGRQRPFATAPIAVSAAVDQPAEVTT